MTAPTDGALVTRLERAPAGLVERLRRRWHGTHEVDPWGLDVDLAALADSLAVLRVSVDVSGLAHVPATGGALVVANRGLDPAWLVALLAGLRRSGRIPRPLGAPDAEPVGPVLRRLGAVAAHAEEVAALLRAGELVVAPLRPRWSGAVGGLAPELVAPAVAGRHPVLPVAVRGREGGRRYAVQVGRPVGSAGGHGAAGAVLTVGEAVDAARQGIDRLLRR